MAEQFANNASTALNGSINSSVTSVVVTAGSVFPASGNFRVICGTEIMLVTARSTNTLTVTRGQEGTTAASHTSGDSIALVYTKGSIDQFLAEFSQTGGYSSRPASPRKGTVYTATDMQSSWWYDGTNWNLVKPVYVPYNRRIILGDWTAANASTETRTDRNGILTLSNVPFNNNAVRGYTKSVPTAPYKCTWILAPAMYATVSFSFYVGHRESATGKLKIMYSVVSGQGVEAWNSYNSFNSGGTFRHGFGGRVKYVRVENDNTNFKYSVSHDGKNFTLVQSEAKGTFFTTAADQVFFGVFASTVYQSPSTAPFTFLGYWEE